MKNGQQDRIAETLTILQPAEMRACPAFGVSRNLVGIYFMRLFVIPCTSVRNFMYGLYGRQK